MIDARFRSLPAHPATPADQRRSRWTFKASWQNTLDFGTKHRREDDGC